MIIYSFRFPGLFMHSCWFKGNTMKALGGILVDSVRIIYKLTCQKWSMQFIETPNFHTHMYTYIHGVRILYICYLCMCASVDTTVMHMIVLKIQNKVEECKGWHFLFIFHFEADGWMSMNFPFSLYLSPKHIKKTVSLHFYFECVWCPQVKPLTHAPSKASGDR